MPNSDPVYINQFNTGNSVSSVKEVLDLNIRDVPGWKAAWKGYFPLWRAFWVHFILGHGAVFGIGCGLFVFGLLTGTLLSPLSSNSLTISLSISGMVILFMYLGFALWAVVTVWRSSQNCYYKRRGFYAKMAMVGYVIAITLPFLWYFIA